MAGCASEAIGADYLLVLTLVLLLPLLLIDT
jgi:hypothetical protein